MPNPEFFKIEFDRLAQENGSGEYIGDPEGEDAFAYLRVSTKLQGEEGRTGLPRQILHIHEVAKKNRLRIPWNLVFADDSTGFEFRDREQLQKLLREVRSQDRPAKAVVMEYLDRLSRNADWHQGYLLEQFERADCDVVFYDPVRSRLERMIRGGVSQEEIERTLARMQEAIRIKARTNQMVTVRWGNEAYGYQLVDKNGEHTEAARQESYYGIVEDQASVVRIIFETIAYHKMSIRALARYLNERYKPPKKARRWTERTITNIIRNPVYKGEFAANRWQFVKRPVQRPSALKDKNRTETVYKRERPRDEWIIVPVPQIVSPELWEMANRALDMNRRSASRNSKHEYLLSGLIRCATCGRVWTGTASWAYSGHPKPEDRDKHKRIYYYRYRCGINRRLREERDEVGCQQKMIRASVLDTAVWQIVCEVLTQPQLILELLDRDFESRHNKQLREQIELIEHELARIEREFERERAAYLAGAYTPSEYAQIRSKLRDRNDQLIIDKRRVEGSMLTAEQVEAQKNMIVEIAEHARRIGLGLDAPFEVRKAVIRTLIDEIILDANAGEFELRGVIRGKHQIPAKIPDTSTARIEHISVEMSAAQSSRTVEEIWAHSKMAEEDRQMLQEKSWREGVRASCPNCEAPLAKNVKFCPECGAKIKGDPHCTECGSKLLPGAKFCPECGTKVGG